MTSGHTGVAVVGGGVAGFRATESLRRAGYAGTVTVLGDEPHPAYQRPPLSKEALAMGPLAAGPPSWLRGAEDHAGWRTGARVVAADLAARVLTLAGGERLSYDGLVVAPGVRARRLCVPGPSGGRFGVRTLDDAAALRASLPGAPRVVVVGAGFLGCEVASTLRRAGHEVSLVVGPEPVPMLGALGADVGAALQRRHEAEGTRVLGGVTVEACTGVGTVTGVLLDSGRHLPADLVVEAVGAVPDVGWLDGNGLDLSDGVACDASLTVADGVVACGDAARAALPLFGGHHRVEHWNHAAETGRLAGRTLVAYLTSSAPGLSVPELLPTFWSDQVGIRVQGLGLPSLGRDDVRVLEGDLGGSAVVGYHRDSLLVGVVLLDAAARAPEVRRELLVGLRAAVAV